MSPEELRAELAALLPPGSRRLTEALAGVAEEFALALLGGRHPACGKWMPKAAARCGLGSGHQPPCRSVWSEKRNKAQTNKRAARTASRREAA